MSVELENNSQVTCDETGLVSLATFALGQMGVHPDSELSITVVDEDEMSRLHLEWMDLAGPTDVLSFPMDEVKPFSSASGPAMVGDIVLCPAFAAAQGLAHPLEHELNILTAHGVLHLLGYDHAEKEAEAEMFALQERIVHDWKSST